MLRLPYLDSGRRYYTCCGKVICSGCVCAPVYDDKGNIVTEKSCPFCRTPVPTSYEETTKQDDKRIKLNDCIAIFNRGCDYDGEHGKPRDNAKAMELWHKAGELGYAPAYFNIGCAYDTGDGVEMNKRKAKHYYELAAMQGHVKARHNLGMIEGQAGNYDRALKHHLIAAGAGHNESLDLIRELHTHGCASKDDYAKALESYQVYLDEIKSDQRDKAAAEDEDYKYIE